MSFFSISWNCLVLNSEVVAKYHLSCVCSYSLVSPACVECSRGHFVQGFQVPIKCANCFVLNSGWVDKILHVLSHQTDVNGFACEKQ